jgi:hypothetical protein
MIQKNKTYSIQENKLTIRGSEIVFNHKIKEVLEIADMLIVLIMRAKGITPNRNVFGISVSKKKIKWQIGKLFPQDNDENCPFVGIRYYNNQLYLNNWCDVYLIVDPLTGEINERGASGK